ncbi:lysine transporter LysE [Geomonas limicola]|uniref:Lysine transporter LysE n=1 Tax=Geomonas limicola TaxID=2740186 RepID=A0A6V8N695_9BACT|nr:LysE family translocator [Geomonas limicola]GFO67337.1 lysine transporter LysE [Geomonas limicola]
MSFQVWLAFVATSAILLVIPGPTVLTLVSYALAHGRSARLPLTAAVALGDATSLCVSILGLGALLATSAFWFTVLKTVGSLYLLFLGFKLLRAGCSASEIGAARPSESRWRMFLNTYLVTALNPKGIVFFVAFLPQFVDPGAAAGEQLWILALTFVGLAIVNATCYTVFAVSARRLLASQGSQRVFNLTGGSLLSAAGVWALWAKHRA